MSTHKDSARPETNEPGLDTKADPSDNVPGKARRWSLSKLREIPAGEHLTDLPQSSGCLNVLYSKICEIYMCPL